MVKVQLIEVPEGYASYAELRIPEFSDYYMDSYGEVQQNFNDNCMTPVLVLTPLKAWRDATQIDIESALDGVVIEGLFGGGGKMPKKSMLTGGFRFAGKLQFMDADGYTWINCKVYK
jgi:hypothetical protein